MFLTLKCHRCPAQAVISCLDVFDLAPAASRRGWTIHTINLSGGRVESRDLCPECVTALAAGAAANDLNPSASASGAQPSAAMKHELFAEPRPSRANVPELASREPSSFRAAPESATGTAPAASPYLNSAEHRRAQADTGAAGPSNRNAGVDAPAERK